jgi:hypothetical protein
VTEPLSPFTRRRIAQLAEATLRNADVVDVFPTPMTAVQNAVGVVERIDMSELPPELEAKKPPAWKRILGALWERTVFVDLNEPEPRVLFTDAHEASHQMCEWHGPTLRLDAEETMYRELKAKVEAEANYGAAQLIFQGGRFHREALQNQLSIRTPIALKPQYGASFHATLHHYVEDHPDPVALLIAGRYPSVEGVLPVWQSVESASFAKRHGRLVDRLPDRKLSMLEGERAPLADILDAAKLAVDPPSKSISIPDLAGTRVEFVAEAFFNQRCNFVLVADRKARRGGRRLRLAS